MHFLRPFLARLKIPTLAPVIHVRIGKVMSVSKVYYFPANLIAPMHKWEGFAIDGQDSDMHGAFARARCCVGVFHTREKIGGGRGLSTGFFQLVLNSVEGGSANWNNSK